VLGACGLVAAIAVAGGVCVARGLSLETQAALVAVAVATFLALAMATKIMLGREALIYYHHEIAVLSISALGAWALGAPVAAALDVQALGIDLLSVSSHKLYGPMGIGALFVRDGLTLRPLLKGGGQQEGRRPGTVPVALAVGFGTACALAAERRNADALWIEGLRERLWAGLAAALPGIRRNSPAENCLPGCLNIAIPGIDAADLLLGLPDLAVATGSACASGSGLPSAVLTAIGLSPELAHASLRFGLGRGTTEAEIDRAATLLAEAVRESNPARG
jgi:cysteine sulfinate desulfinase/cysteine desulfurase-like protein